MAEKLDPLASEQPHAVSDLETQYAKSVNDSWTKHMADKIRTDLPSIKDATDDEAMQVFHQMSVPDASPEEYTKVLEGMYGKDYIPPSKPSLVKGAIAHVQDFAQGLTNQVTAIPKSLYEGIKAVSKGVEVGPTQPGAFITLQGKTPEASELLSKSHAHLGEGGAFAAGALAGEATAGLVNPIVSAGVAKAGGGVVSKTLGGAIKGAAGWGAFGGAGEAVQAEDPSKVFDAFEHGFSTGAPMGAFLGGVGGMVGPIAKRAWKAGRATKTAQTLPEAKAAAAKVASTFQGEWAPISADPQTFATDFLTKFHGPDVTESDSGQRAIRLMIKKINTYRENQSVKSAFAGKSPENFTLPDNMTMVRESGEGTGSLAGESPEAAAAKKQIITKEGPLWNYGVQVGEKSVEMRNVVAKDAAEAERLAQLDAEHTNGKLIGDVTPQYERASDRRVIQGQSPIEERRTTERRGLTEEEKVKFENIKEKGNTEVTRIESLNGDELKKEYAAKYPDAELPSTKNIRTELTREAQSQVKGASDILNSQKIPLQELVERIGKSSTDDEKKVLAEELATRTLGISPHSDAIPVDVTKASSWTSYLKDVRDKAKANPADINAQDEAFKAEQNFEAWKNREKMKPSARNGALIVDPTSREQQAPNPEAAKLIRRMEKDPLYRAQISDLGGGRRVSHVETLQKATSTPPMTVEELSSWKAGTPVEEVLVVRANMLRAKLLDDFQQGTFESNPMMAREAWEGIVKSEAGYNNLTGTPGRATEIQSIFKMNKMVADKIEELKSINAPIEQVTKELDAVIKQAKKEAKLTKKEYTARWVHTLEDYATAAKLTSPVTHTINSVSNFLVYLERAMEKTTTAAQLKTMGMDAEAEATLKYAWGVENGFVNGVRKASEVFKSGESYGGSKTEISRKGAELPGVIKLPFKALEAADAFWMSIIHDSELTTKAYVQAAREGLEGEAKASRIKNLMENAPDTWKEHAMLVAKEYTFKESPDRFLRAIQTFQNVPGMRLVVPFVQTPYNLMRFYVRRSPLMLVPPKLFGMKSNSFYRDLEAGGVRQAEAISRLAIGLGFHTAAYVMVKNNQVTGQWPSNPKEAELWKETGKQPWSIKVGNYWFQYNRLQPVGSFLSAVAAYHTAMEENKFDKAQDHLGKALAQMLKGPLDVPFLQGMSSLTDLVNDPEGSFQKFVNQTTAGLIPNILRDVRLQMDPTVRKAKDWGDVARLMIPIPSVYESVNPDVTALGKTRVAGKPLESRPIPVLTRGLTSKITEDDKTKLMAQLGWTPPKADPKFEFNGEEAEITDKKLLLQYQTDVGKAADQAMTLVMANEKFASLTDPQKKKLLAQVVSRFQSPVKELYKVLSGVYGEEGEKYRAEVETKLKEIQKEGLHG